MGNIAAHQLQIVPLKRESLFDSIWKRRKKFWKSRKISGNSTKDNVEWRNDNDDITMGRLRPKQCNKKMTNRFKLHAFPICKPFVVDTGKGCFNALKKCFSLRSYNEFLKGDCERIPAYNLIMTKITIWVCSHQGKESGHFIYFA